MKKYLIGVIAAGWGASSAFAALPVTNYNAALEASPAGTVAKFAPASAGQIRSGSFVLPGKTLPAASGYPSHVDAQMGKPTFLWADGKIQPAITAPIKGSKLAESAARDYLLKQGDVLQLGKVTVDAAKLTHLHDTGSGPMIARFQQMRNGLEVFNQQMNVMMDRDLKLVATSGYFAPEDTETVSAAAGKPVATAARVVDSFIVSPERAISLAFADFSGQALESSKLSVSRIADDYSVFKMTGKQSGNILMEGEPRTKKVYFYVDGKYVPAYYTEVGGRTFDLADSYAFGYVISATDGKVLFRKDQIDYDTNPYTYRAYADANGIHQPFDSPLGNELDPYIGSPINGAQVLPRPGVATNLVTLSNGPISTNDPWLPVGAINTTGNNVEAYLDLFGTADANGNILSGDGFQPNTTDQRGVISSANTFDYSYTPDQDPTTQPQRNFAIVNQFYVDNWLHDWWYDNGFNESAGNAQTNNFGRGGVGNDSLRAEGEDFSGRNNANESTPADGGRPRQQMYLFDGPGSSISVNSPTGFANPVPNTAAFGPQTFDVTANVVAAIDAAGTPAGSTTTDGCTAFTNAAAVSGQIALVDRGTCSFQTKTVNAQIAGAVGIIIANNAPGLAPGLAGDTTQPVATIGTLSVSQGDGVALRAALTPGPLNVRLLRAPVPDIDGTVDIQVIAHEWFHTTSNRLVGNASGLSNQQGRGMGEGWSDFDAQLLTVRPEDRSVPGNNNYQGAYSSGFYVTHNTYFGIRRTPYSTSLSIDPLTFRHISDGVALPTTAPINALGVNSEVHNTGEIWCNTLWEVYASLLNDPRYSFTQARERMKTYVLMGLMMTPNAPTVLEARNGILAATRATDAQDFNLAATAFAKRGMGVGAIAPDRNSTTNANAIENFTAFAGAFTVTNAALDFGYVNGAAGYIDNDGILDPGETALLSLSIVNNGTAPITSPVVANLSSNGDTTFGNGGQITFPASPSAPIAIGGTAAGTITVRLNSATQTSQSLTLTIAFPQVGATPTEVFEAPNVSLTLLVNYDIRPNQLASDNFEQPLTSVRDWPAVQIGTGTPWTLRTASSLTLVNTTGNVFFATNNTAPTDERLTTPVIAAGNGFSISFSHYFSFETQTATIGYDGGIIEISNNNGATWTDVLSAGGTFTAGAGYNGSFLALSADGSTLTPDDNGGHVGFVNNNGPLTARLPQNVTLSFGNTYAGQNVRLRFREVTDNGGSSLGWSVDNVSFTGINNLPFSAIAPEDGIPDNQPPVANAGPDQNAVVRTLVTLNGSGSTDDAGVTSYTWTEVSGPATVTLASVANPTFTPTVTGRYVFRLTVADVRTLTSTDDVQVTVYSSASPNAYTFNPVANVELSTTQTSNTITVSGLGAGVVAPISVTGGQYGVNGAGFTSASGTVVNGDTVVAQAIASSSYDTRVQEIVRIGSLSSSFLVTTRKAVTTPDTFNLVAVNNAELNTVYVSNAIVVAGIEAPASASVTGGDYSVNGGPFVTAGTVSNGDSVVVRTTSSPTANTRVAARLTIGGRSGSFTVTTRR